MNENMAEDMAIELKKVVKIYGSEQFASTALKEVSIDFNQREFTVIVGKSGSGKSTLLNMLSGIDRPTSGEIFHRNYRLHDMSEAELTEWRGRNIGIVFQFFQLIPTLTVRENILLPMDFCRVIPASKRKRKADKLLDRMGVSSFAHTLPLYLSGGEQQRVAIARALANDPQFIVADEPTGNLDTQNAEAVIDLFQELKESGKGIIMVTHSDEIAKQADRIVTIHDGIVGHEQGKSVA